MEAKEVWSSSKSLIPRELKAAYKAPFPGLVSILPGSELALGEQPYPQGIAEHNEEEVFNITAIKDSNTIWS